MRFFALIVVTMLTSMLTLLILASSEATTITSGVDSARTHAQAVWCYHIVEVVESWKIVGLSAILLLWCVHRYSGTVNAWWCSPVRDIAALAIWLFCAGIIVLIGAEEFLSMASHGFDAQMGVTQATSSPLIAASVLELTFPLGLALVWVSKPDGRTMLD